MKSESVEREKILLPRLNQGGFTLVELLVVIAIIAILSVVGLVIYGQAQVKARDARRQSDISAVADAFEQYNINNGSYPTDVRTPTMYYMNSEIPRDAKSNADGSCKTTAASEFCYNCGRNGSTCPGTSFKICAKLEQTTTPFCKGNRQ